MSATAILLMGVVTVTNFIFIMYKLNKQRYADVTIDIIVLVILSILFGGTAVGMQIAMSASAIMSIYLFFFPPTFLSDSTEDTTTPTSRITYV